MDCRAQLEHLVLKDETVKCELAARMKAVIRKIDMVVRLEGDEFSIMLPVIKDNNDILTIILRMCQTRKT